MILDYYHEKLMLIGSSERLDFRINLKSDLAGKGYREIIIMEETDESITDRGLDGKFRRILEQDIPACFFAIFHRGAKMDGVAFELGWLCGILTAPQLAKRLRILHEIGYDWKETSAYVPGLFTHVPHHWFYANDEAKEHQKASTYIDYCMKFRNEPSSSTI